MILRPRRPVFASLAFALLAFAGRAQASAQEGPQAAAAAILAGSHLFGSSPCEVIKLEMDIRSGAEGKKREVELSIDRRGGRVLILARILSPAFLTDMKFLKRSEPGQPDSQWVRTSRGTRRLGASNRSEAVFGSHFTVEDFGNVDAAAFALGLAPERDAAGARAVSALPKGPAGYARRLVLVDRATGLVTAMEYLDASGAAIRRYRVTSVSGEGSAARPSEAVMEDLAGGGSTILRVLGYSTPASLPERLFNPGAL